MEVYLGETFISKTPTDIDRVLMVSLNENLSDRICWNAGFPVFVTFPSHCHGSIELSRESPAFVSGLTSIWPSEQLLTAVCMENPRKFDGKRVVELGTGFHGLCALAIAKYLNPRVVTFVDGCAEAMDCLRKSLFENKVSDRCAKVGVLQSTFEEIPEVLEGAKGSYDVVLASDCVLFANSRKPLLEAVMHLLSKNGLFILSAPSRKPSLSDFLHLAEKAGLHCHVIKRKHARKNPVANRFPFDPDIHSPVLITMTKNESTDLSLKLPDRLA